MFSKYTFSMTLANSVPLDEEEGTCHQINFTQAIGMHIEKLNQMEIMV